MQLTRNLPGLRPLYLDHLSTTTTRDSIIVFHHFDEHPSYYVPRETSLPPLGLGLSLRLGEGFALVWSHHRVSGFAIFAKSLTNILTSPIVPRNAHTSDTVLHAGQSRIF